VNSNAEPSISTMHISAFRGPEILSFSAAYNLDLYKNYIQYTSYSALQQFHVMKPAATKAIGL
jgi:hypothetical protein